MKTPRDLSGVEIVRLLGRHYGYRHTRTSGSHMNVTLTVGGRRHSVTVPRHRYVDVGTLSAIVSHVAAFLGLPGNEVRAKLFG